MAEENNRIHLTTPAADRNADPDTITKPQALRAWLEDLPYANPLGTAQALLASIKLLNRHPGKLSQRADLMLIYLDPFLRVVSMARKLSYKINVGLTPPREAVQTVAAASAICTEMSYGFKHIVNTELNTNSKVTPEDLALHIQLAMHSLSLGLLFEMSSYQAESKTTWREIFQLLMGSQQLGVASMVIPGETLGADYEVSVVNSFKSILLTSVLDTSRLSPEETWASHDYLLRHASNARLLPLDQTSDVSGNYLVPRNGTKKPVLYTRESPPPDPENHMVCETHKLNVQINEHLEMLAGDNTTYIKGTDALKQEYVRPLLRQMLHIWHNNPKRRHERKEKFDRLSCAFGVGAVHHFLKNGSMRSSSSSTLDQDDVSNSYLISRPGDIKQSDGLHIYEFRQENISASGVGIKSSDPDVSNLKIGQLVVIESKISNPPVKMRVGVVRRLVKIDNNSHEVGIQFLPGRQIPATALPEIFGRKHKADIQPSMLLDLGENHPKAIITPHLIYNAGRHYVLDVSGGDTKRIVADKLLETTTCFDCFEYSILKLS